MTMTWLASFPSPPRGVWHLGPIPIRAYAFFIVVGIVVALLIIDRRWAARGGQRGVVYDIALWVVPFGLIGGRLYHLATDWRTYFAPGGAGFAAALRIWDGGLGIWGAIAFGVLGGWIACRRRKIPFLPMLDAAAPGVVLAQAIGRLGNYFNQELYGRETTLPWGLEIFCRRDPAGFVGGEDRCNIGSVHSLDGVSTGQVAFVVQPTFLYELIWNVLVFAALIYLDRRFTLSHGRLFAAYIALYCAGRFWVELLRDDPATHIAGIRINSFTSTFVFIAAVVYIILATKGREDAEVLRGTDFVAAKAPEPEPAAEMATAETVTAVTAAASPGPDEDDRIVESEEVTQRGEAADAEVAEPEVAEVGEPEVAEPEAGEAEAAETKAAELETGEVEVAEPRAAEPETAEPAVAEPEVAAPLVADDAAVAEPEAGGWLRRLRSRRRKAPISEDVTSEVAEPEAAQTEVAEDETAETEPAAVEAAEPEAAEAEVEYETSEAEVAERDVAEDEVAEPETPEPEPAEAEAAEPEPAEPEPAEPEPAEPETAQSEPEADESAEAEAEFEAAEGEVEEPEAVEPDEPEPDEPKAAEAQDESVTPAETPTAQDDDVSESDAATEDQEERPEPAAEQEPAEETAEDQTPIPLVTPDSAGTTRQRWRQRLRNLRSRSGR